MSASLGPRRLPSEILTELRGLPYRWESGKKHWILRIAGDFVAIWPHGTTMSTGRTQPWMGVRSNIRRWKRGERVAL